MQQAQLVAGGGIDPQRNVNIWDDVFPTFSVPESMQNLPSTPVRGHDPQGRSLYPCRAMSDDIEFNLIRGAERLFTADSL